MAKVKEDKIGSFSPQTRNSNKHSQRGMGALEASMRKHGFVAPITAAADGQVIDGSARLETVANVFDDDVIVIHHTGDKPIIMVRDDIESADTPEAREISIAANRIAELNLVYDAEVLLADMQSGVDLNGLFDQAELDALLAGSNDVEIPDPKEQKEPELKGDHLVEIYCSQDDLKDFQEVLNVWSKRPSVTINIS